MHAMTEISRAFEWIAVVVLILAFLLAADLIRTVAVEPTIANVGVLGVIVLVRTLLVFSLDVEIDGVLPWRKRALGVTDAEQ